MLKPTKLLQAMKMKDKFTANHPEFMLFLKKLQKQNLKQGSEFTITVKTSDDKILSNTLTINKEDEEIINMFL